MRAASLMALVLVAPALSQQTTVVPAGFDSVDAPSQLWIAGAMADLRQQILVDASHLVAMSGRSLTAIELRRNVADETFGAGTCQLAVTLSTSGQAPMAARRTFAANVGIDAVQVFSGLVGLPQSPNAPTTPPWTAPHVVRIDFTVPFLYQGGTLCIDLVGQAIAGQETSWWMADAAYESLQGTANRFGDGCGSYGGTNGHWFHVDPATLLPGGEVRFEADGPAGHLGFLLFGTPAVTPIALTAMGLPAAPECRSQLDPANVLGVAAAPFAAASVPGSAALGVAEVYLRLPTTSPFFGFSFSTQWLELPTFATSNGVRCTTASGLPALGLALVQGHPLEADGTVNLRCGPVLRFEHQ